MIFPAVRDSTIQPVRFFGRLLFSIIKIDRRIGYFNCLRVVLDGRTVHANFVGENTDESTITDGVSKENVKVNNPHPYFLYPLK